MTVIRQVDDNWLEGKKGDKIGIFPISFVKVSKGNSCSLVFTSPVRSTWRAIVVTQVVRLCIPIPFPVTLRQSF